MPIPRILALASVRYLGQKGFSDGLESDSNNNIYCGSLKDNSIVIYYPDTGVVTTFVRDPRFSWTDTMSVGQDGYLYFTENQLWLGPNFQGGVDKRVRPFVLLRVKLLGDGTKITQKAP